MRPALIAAAVCGAAHAARPNFLFIITDDQDIELGSMAVMPALQQRVVDQGLSFDGAYVDSPICCPSRTSLFTSRLSHNLRDQTLGWCGNFTSQRENTFTTSLAANAGYVVGQIGKWYNEEGTFCGAGGSQPFVPVWKQGDTPRAALSDFFVMCSEVKFYNMSYNHNGELIQTGDGPEDYLTAYLGNASLAWLDRVTSPTTNPDGLPWLGYVALHAPHLPATPAPWYMNATLPGAGAPRTPNFNTGWADKHWLVDNGLTTPMSQGLVDGADALWAARLRSLMSVDDVVGAALDLLASRGALDNTYVIYTSDHGYHLGQWGMAGEKASPYETDARVPLFIRGPGIAAGSHSSALVSNVDLAPTLLDLAGIPDAWPDGSGRRDGRSLVPLLGRADPAPPPGWRDRLLIQYVGWTTPWEWLSFCQFNLPGLACPSNTSTAPQWLANAQSNTYTSLRTRNATHNALYAEFRPFNTSLSHTATNWTEAYDLGSDPWQLTNLAVAGRMPGPTLAQWSRELWAVATCVGAACP